MPDPAANPRPVLIIDDVDGGYTSLHPGHPLLSIPDDTLIVIATPCRLQGRRGGAGGQMITACGYCGQSMASSAGPHPRSGWQMVPCIAMAVNGGVVWRRADPSDFPAAEETPGA